MKAIEVRLGNIVKRAIGWSDNERLQPVLFSNEPYIIDSVNHLDCDLCDFPSEKNSITATLEDLQPIPLTEEWLRRFGFVLIKDCNWSNGKMGLFFDNGFCDFKGVKIKYVHKLQNLYYEHFDEELTLIQ